MRADQVVKNLQTIADAAIAEHSQRFFKTGPGQYGEGDLFLGIRVPELRKQVKRYADLPLDEIKLLLASPFHEIRLFALLLLVERFNRADRDGKTQVYRLYLESTACINNWDLVDSSAHHIVGGYLSDRDRSVLYDLVGSDDLWERRIAIIASFYFIKRDDFYDALRLCEHLLKDKHDLIHKATGWMLREIGKRDQPTEKKFLDRHYKNMPRTMLRYAIEKLPEQERQAYLKGEL
ncbi:DNA alkylation repair protein [Thiomicrorhabdus heinhorstiae]|uniref:DNA alkylation repair protein n=1 Tax=Thiomicrorhabdus heinhorstiae TaxID=2748010 RepID=A0ABS0BUG8_9GAMM|nr:DNA alkylation repair protein [Thiomicrorhabdus heinhorstiae]MBF6056750.1 DNA alkylation repair protein [Thiomicrorhabdus heinhorstiae]